MMMARYNNHIFSTSLLIAPGIDAASRGDGRGRLSALLLGGLYVPPLLYFATARMILVCWLVVGLMLAVLAVVVWADVRELLRSSPTAASGERSGTALG